MRTRYIALLGALALSGCKPSPTSQFEEADLTRADVVHDLANTISAPKAYTVAVVLAAALDPEATCPAASPGPDAETTIYTGGCTDESGHTWFGQATVRVEGEQVGVITYEDFGSEGPQTCTSGGTVTSRSSFDGTVTLVQDGSYTIDVTGEGDDVDLDACTATRAEVVLTYEGQRVDTSDTVSVWSGHGEVGNSTLGRAEAETVDEVVDEDGCETEAQSGATTLTTKDHTVVITYDGATDCDPESTVTWTLDGADQGELLDVSCATPGAAFGAWAWIAGVAALRRRR